MARNDRIGLALQAILVFAVVTTALLILALMFSADDDRALILECTTAPELREPPELDPRPSDCYVRSQARTGEAVGSINDVVILAAACARQPENATVDLVRACVEEGLADR